MVFTVHLKSILDWMRSEGNWIMFEFQTTTEDEVKAAFASPSVSKTNPKLVEHLKSMEKGAAIKLPLNHGLKSDRSLKRQVNAAAKEANRELEWAKGSDGWIARVTVINGTMSTNGTTSSNSQEAASTTAPVAEEAATSRRR